MIDYSLGYGYKCMIITNETSDNEQHIFATIYTRPIVLTCSSERIHRNYSLTRTSQISAIQEDSALVEWPIVPVVVAAFFISVISSFGINWAQSTPYMLTLAAAIIVTTRITGNIVTAMNIDIIPIPLR